jgi:DNA-binding GntR family transcriptional regulator
MIADATSTWYEPSTFDPRRVTSTRQTKVSRVYAELKRGIMAGDYPPGTRIVADQVAEALGVSTVPIREALLRLSGEGWVELSPHVGAIVPQFDPNEILETALIRAALESTATRLATPHLSLTDLELLEQHLDAMDLAAEKSSVDYPALNMRFHLMIVAACPYPRMRDLITQIAEKTMRLRTVTFIPHYVAESQREHHQILDALRSRDADVAESLARRHIEKAGQLLWEHATSLRTRN